jgi:hypothetical protein
MSTQELLYVILIIATSLVTGFLCWALYELATLLHKANRVVDETAQKISRIEHMIIDLKDKLTHSVNYLGLLAEGGKALLTMFQRKEEKDEQEKSSRRKKKSELFDDEE